MTADAGLGHGLMLYSIDVTIAEAGRASQITHAVPAVTGRALIVGLDRMQGGQLFLLVTAQAGGRARLALRTVRAVAVLTAAIDAAVGHLQFLLVASCAASCRQTLTAVWLMTGAAVLVAEIGALVLGHVAAGAGPGRRFGCVRGLVAGRTLVVTTG